MKTAGRPRKSILERRSAIVKVCLSLNEAIMLDRQAKEASLSVSEYLRSRALVGQTSPTLAPALKHDVYRLLLAVQRGLHDGIPAPALAERMQAVIERLQS